MKWIAFWCFALGFLALAAKAYQVYEEPEKDDETVRGKRQESSVSVIDSIFNIPIAAIKQTSSAAQSLSPQNAGTIDSVLKIPVTTLEAVSRLIKNRYQNTTPISRPSRQSQRRVDEVESTSTDDELKRRLETHREHQRLYQRQLHRRRMELLQQHNRRVQQQILEEDEREHHRFYRDPLGFNALAKWIVGPQGYSFNGHAGHGDGHVYQYYNERKPLPFGGQVTVAIARAQGVRQASTTQSTPSLESRASSSKTPAGSSPIISSKSSSSSSGMPSRPAHIYAVREVVDEGVNPFTWPNWFGILHALGLRAAAAADGNEKPASDKPKVRFDDPQLPLQNKIAPKDEDYYKSKYAKAKKNNEPREEEITGNEIDADVLLASTERKDKLFFPTN